MRHCPSRLVSLFMVMALFGTTSVMANNETTSSVPGLLSSFAGSKILLIGLLESSLTIITKDASPQVYDVPMAKFADSKFDLYGLAPVELNSKWPALISNTNFTSTVLSQKQPLSISIKLDNEKLTFVFACNSEDAKNILKTVTLSVNPPSAIYQEYQTEKCFDIVVVHLISSSEQNVFFDLVFDHGHPYQLVKYVYQSSGGFTPTLTSVMCKQMGTNGTEMIVFKNLENSIGCISFEWDIQNGGFVDQNRFHLFSRDTVYIFEYTGTGADPDGVPLEAIKLSDFFVSVIPTTTTIHLNRTSTRKAGPSTGTIIVIVCGVLLVLGIIIIAVVVWCKYHKKHSSPKDTKMRRSSSSRKGTVRQSQTQVSSSRFKKKSTSTQGNTSACKKPKLTETRGLQSSSQARQSAATVVKMAAHDDPALTMIYTDKECEKMKHLKLKPERFVLHPNGHPKDENGKTKVPTCFADFYEPGMAAFMADATTETDPDRLKKIYLACPLGMADVPAQVIGPAVRNYEAKKRQEQASLRRGTSSGRLESRQKVSPKQRTSSSKQSQQKQQYRVKQTEKAKLAKLAVKHSKGKGSKGSVATRKPTSKKSSCRLLASKGRKGSKATKRSNRKF